MRTLIYCFTFCLILSLFTCGQPSVANSGANDSSSEDAPTNRLLVEGDWTGTLSVQGMVLHIIFHLKIENGNFTATMDSPDQGAYGLPCNEAQWKDGQLTLRLSNLGVRYEGQLQDEQLVGTFYQGSAELPLTLDRTTAPQKSAASRPQTPQAPFAYSTQDITFPNAAADGIQLAGTLTTPKDCNQCPAVVLISGSGPQDRNETLMGHEPFWVIADYLTRRGIAVLRFDDRGVGASEGVFKIATSADFMTDVAAAVTFLRQHPTLNTPKIGLIGHSEGSMIAAMLAAQESDIAFVVSLAGPGIPGKDLLPQQAKLIGLAQNSSSEAVEAQYKTSKEACQLIATVENKTELRTALASLFEAQGLSGEPLNSALDQYTSDWFCFFMRYDPAPDWQKVACPVLALNGAKDLQVPADDNLRAIAQSLKAGQNPPHTIQKFEGLNHLFQQAETGSPTEYGQIEETFNTEVLAFMSEWILQH